MNRTAIIATAIIACSWLRGPPAFFCNAQRPVIAAYLPEYRSYINVNNTAPYLTDLILFSLAPSKGGMLGGCCLEDHHFEQAGQARSYKEESSRVTSPQDDDGDSDSDSSRRSDTGSEEDASTHKLNVWVSLGGAGRQDWFVDVARDPTKRATLWSQLVSLSEKQGIDGVDFDCVLADKNAKQPSHQQVYALVETFLKEAVEVLHSHGLLVSIALRPGMHLSKDVYDGLDRIHLMTYDMVQHSQGHAYIPAVVRAVRGLMESGCPSDKIVLGIPAYGRHVQMPGQVKTFAEIVDELQPKTVKEIQSPWQQHAFDDSLTVRKKVLYATRDKLAGIFFWELGQDKQRDDLRGGGILLETAFRQFQALESASRHSTRSTGTGGGQSASAGGATSGEL